MYGKEEQKSYIITRYFNHFYTCSCQRMTPSIIVEKNPDKYLFIYHKIGKPPQKKDFFFISIPFVYNMIFMRLEFLIWMLFTIRISQKVCISDLFQLIVYLYSLYNNHSLHESYRNKVVTQIFTSAKLICFPL